MSFDGGGKPGKGSGATATSLNGMPSAVTRAVKRIACNVSKQGVGAKIGNHESVITSIGHEAAPMFFWGGKAAREKAEHR
jgi:hypothetical protein